MTTRIISQRPLCNTENKKRKKRQPMSERQLQKEIQCKSGTGEMQRNQKKFQPISNIQQHKKSNFIAHPEGK